MLIFDRDTYYILDFDERYSSLKEGMMKKTVRFLRLAAVIICTAIFGFFLAFKIADFSVAIFPRLSDNRSHGWGAIFSISGILLAKGIGKLFCNDRVYRKIVGDSSPRSGEPTDMCYSGHSGTMD